MNSTIHSEMKYLLSTYLPSFKEVCGRSQTCPHNMTTCHITVVRLSSNGFGKIFNYCPIEHDYHMSPSAEQCDIPLDNNHLSRIIDLIPTVEMQKCEGRHLLLGAVPQWNRTVEFDRRLRVEEKRVVVEVFWFLIGRELPVSVPMIGVVDGGEIYVLISQPITQQMLPWLNPWYTGNTYPCNIEVWSTVNGRWRSLNDPSALHIRLPFTEIPVLRLQSSRECRPRPNDIARGYAGLPSMCSMKAQMYDLPHIWPQGLFVPRSRLNGVWRTSRNVATQRDIIRPWGPYQPDGGVKEYMDGSTNAQVLGLPAIGGAPAHGGVQGIANNGAGAGPDGGDDEQEV